MIGTKFAVSFHVPGTLAANLVMYWTAQADCQLIHVSCVGSNSNNGLIDVGPSTDVDGWLDGKDIGDSNVPIEYAKADFVGAEFPHCVKGTIIVVSLDYDGSSGTATHDFTVVLTFTEG
jgi:hypothetical protein